MLYSQESFDPDGDLVLVLTKSTEKIRSDKPFGGLQTSSGLFGSCPTSQPVSGGFGSSTSSSHLGSTLGSSTTGGSFGAVPVSSHLQTRAFGAAPTSTQSQSRGLFEASPAPTQTPSGGLFGHASTPGIQTTGLQSASSTFGNSSGTQNTGSLFGNLPSAQATTTAFHFGSRLASGASPTSTVSTTTLPVSVIAGNGSGDEVPQTGGSLFGRKYHKIPKSATTAENTISEIRMLVSSRHMMLASPVFKAMLNGNFKEGRTLKTDGKVDIELPDDDVDTFRIILNIIHGRNRSVPRTIDLNCLTQIAVLVDKYQMVEAVESYSGSWILALKFPMQERYCSDLGKWICVSWVFDLASDFAALTRLAVQQSPGDVSDGFMDYIPLPKTVHDGINSRRQKAISALYSLIGRKIKSYMAPQIQCIRTDGKAKTCDALMLGTLLKSASITGFWPAPSPPYSNTSYDGIASLIRVLDVESLCESDNGGRPGFGSQVLGHGMKGAISAETSLINEKHITGLVLSEYKRATRSST